jgi:hypothetical protein
MYRLALFDLMSKVEIDPNLLLKAYFEDYKPDSLPGKRIPNLKRMYKQISDKFGSVAVLDKIGDGLDKGNFSVVQEQLLLAAVFDTGKESNRNRAKALKEKIDQIKLNKAKISDIKANLPPKQPENNDSLDDRFGYKSEHNKENFKKLTG